MPGKWLAMGGGRPRAELSSSTTWLLTLWHSLIIASHLRKYLLPPTISEFPDKNLNCTLPRTHLCPPPCLPWLPRFSVPSKPRIPPMASTLGSHWMSCKSLCLFFTFPQATFNCLYVPQLSKTKCNTASTSIITITITATTASLMLVPILLLFPLGIIY